MEAVSQDLKPVRVKFRQLDYITRGINPLGDEVDMIRTAYGPGMPQNDPALSGLDPTSQEYADKASDYRFGELVLLRPRQYVGLIKSGAVHDVETDEETGEELIEEEQLLDVNVASIDDLADWIRTERPTVNDVVQASDGDPEIARRLLEAESQVQEGAPRKGVLEGLSAVISRG
jgi:hypothetical protein